MPSITTIVKKHWRTMTSQDPHLNEVFPFPPLVAYKVGPNLRRKLIRAKVPPAPANRPSRQIPGMKKCGKATCQACPYVQTGKSFRATATNHSVEVLSQVDCETKNLLYAISCTVANCRQQYIGTTYRSLRERFREHLGYVDKNVEATGAHFNLPGHSKADMKVMVVEKVNSRDLWLREEREHELIRNCNTYYKGINRKI